MEFKIITTYSKTTPKKIQKIFFGVVFLLFNSFIFSQQEDYKILIQNISDKAWEAIVEEKDSGIYYSNKIIEISKKNDDLFNEMLGYQYRGVYNEAILNYYEKAIQDYLVAIGIAEKHHKDFVPDMYIEIGILFQKTGDDQKALSYLEKAVEISEKNSITHCFAALSLAKTQSKLKQYDKAHRNFTFFIEHKQLNETDKEEAYLGIAKNFSRQHKFDKAIAYYLKSIKNDSLKGKKKFASYYADFIENAIKMGDVKSIKKYKSTLEKSYSQVVPLREKLIYYKTLSKAYEFLKNYNKAYLYQDSIIYTNEILSKERYNQDLSELETKYQTKKKEEQITEEQSKKQLWSAISIFAFVILLIVAILLYKNSKKRKQLKTNKIELENLLNQRNMLLKETHHRVKNSFQMVSSLLQLQAQGSRAESAVKALDNAVQRVNSMIVLHQQLYAKDNVLGVDLQIYINDLIKEISNSYSSENINFKSSIISIITDIDTATSIGLLVNELATNSIKYAWNENLTEKVINLNIDLKNDVFSFKMFDNGLSKKTETTQQNYGSELIKILIERLDAEKQPFSENDFGLYITFKKQNG